MPLKQVADEAVAGAPSIENVIVVQRGAGRGATRPAPCPMTMKAGRDHWYHELMKDAPLECDPEPMDSEDMLYILYTSGTTGKPKGIVHTTGGYLVGTYATTKLVFDLRDEDVYWCTADIGWVTGHSYVVYGPLANGATVLMYEGAPDWPQKDRFWSLDRAVRRHDLLYGADGDPRVHAVGHRVAGDATTCRRSGCSARSASRSIPRRGCGTTRSSAAIAVRSSTRGGRPKPARS